MGTRCGQIDPGVVLYLMAEKKMSADAISDLLWKNSGLKGMSGLSQDMRELEASDSPAARDAIAYFVARIRRELAGLAATVNGAEAIVFTAGIGEHSWKVREAVLKDMEWMGIHLDAQANRANAQIISAKNSPTIVFVIPTNEELMIAEHTVGTRASANSGVGNRDAALAPIPVAACEHGKRHISGCPPTAQESKTGDPDEGNYRQRPCCRWKRPATLNQAAAAATHGAGEEGIQEISQTPAPRATRWRKLNCW